MKISRRQFIWSGVLALPAVFALDAFWLEQFFVEFNEFYWGNATRDQKGIKVLQLSDLHLHKISYRHYRLAEKIKHHQPDLIVFTGDAIDRKRNLPLLKQFLELIDPAIPKAAIPGNKEYDSHVDIDALAKLYADFNGTLLINEGKRFQVRDKTITITGI